MFNHTDMRDVCMLAANGVMVAAVDTILVLHVGVIRHHVPCHHDLMFPRSCAKSGSGVVYGNTEEQHPDEQVP